MRVLVTSTSLCRNPNHSELDALKQVATVEFSDLGRPLTADELKAALPGVDAVLAGVDDFSAEAFSAADQLKVVSRLGVGTDRVDLDAARERGIAVSTTPGANAVGVAELAVGLMFSVARGIPALHNGVVAGEWPRMQGVELRGKTLAILGVGAIGRLVASAAHGIGMHVRGYDPFVDPTELEELGIEPCDLDSALTGANVVSLHLPLTSQTRNVIDATRIAGLGDDAIVINTARGGLIDEPAARAALDSGALWGIGLDAYEVEPPTDSVLVGHERVVSTPHAGAATKESVARTTRHAVRNILDAFAARGEF